MKVIIFMCVKGVIHTFDEQRENLKMGLLVFIRIVSTITYALYLNLTSTLPKVSEFFYL